MDTAKKKAIGIKIRQKREALGISQLELAKSVHKKSPAYIAFIESGERNISTMDLMLIAKSLGTTVADLIGESKNNAPKTDVMLALRSDKGLTPKDRKTLEELYQVYKNKNDNK